MRALILGVRRTRKLGIEDETKETVFNELMDSNLSPEDLSLARLQDEAVSLIGAGIESTRWTLTLACYHILDQPSILARLQQELRDAIPDQSKPLSLSQLEQLPYLAAVVEEGRSCLALFTLSLFNCILLTDILSYSCPSFVWCYSALSTGFKGQAVSLWVVDNPNRGSC